MSERTIAAVATPPGEGSVGVIRISGEKAIEIADSVFFAVSDKPLSVLKGYTAAYGEIRDGETVLDDAVALVFKAPKSYTRRGCGGNIRTRRRAYSARYAAAFI